MTSQVLEAPLTEEEPKSTFNARADAVTERLRATNTPITLVTVGVRFQENVNAYALPSRLVEQEVLDLLDAPPTSR